MTVQKLTVRCELKRATQITAVVAGYYADWFRTGKNPYVVPFRFTSRSVFLGHFQDEATYRPKIFHNAWSGTKMTNLL